MHDTVNKELEWDLRRGYWVLGVGEDGGRKARIVDAACESRDVELVGIWLGLREGLEGVASVSQEILQLGRGGHHEDIQAGCR
jgi:hypothetical protein